MQLEEMYRKSFFARRKSLIWRAKILCPIIIRVFDLSTTNKPSSLIDIGCGIGEFVAEFNRVGIDAYGLEGSFNAEEYALVPLIYFDIREDAKMLLEDYGKFDLCLSLEVAEHIEEEYARNYVENLCLSSDHILVSAAPPGSEGHYHFNCQPKEYWEELFKIHGYKRNSRKEELFRHFLEIHKKKKGLSSYYQNSMIFERG